MANQGNYRVIRLIFGQGSVNWLTKSWWNITYFDHLVDKVTAMVGFLTAEKMQFNYILQFWPLNG